MMSFVLNQNVFAYDFFVYHCMLYFCNSSFSSGSNLIFSGYNLSLRNWHQSLNSWRFSSEVLGKILVGDERIKSVGPLLSWYRCGSNAIWEVISLLIYQCVVSGLPNVPSILLGNHKDKCENICYFYVLLILNVNDQCRWNRDNCTSLSIPLKTCFQWYLI